MQRLSGILLFLILIILPASNCYATGNGMSDYTLSSYEDIDNRLNINIDTLVDRLHDSCFEQPHNNYTVHSRQGKLQPTWRRTYNSDKAGIPFATLQNSKQKNPFSSLCHTAIATSRHNRGYYIYALRHIII